MKSIFTLLIFFLALNACSVPQTQGETDTHPTDMPQVSIPNPASVYCTEQGNKHEIRSTADGSQSGVCFFFDGSSCDEWAYFRGECGPAVQNSPTPSLSAESIQKASNGGAVDASGGYMPPGTSEGITDWWGVIKSTPAGAQYDDYFERQDLGTVIPFGIDSLDPAIKAQIDALRDSGKIIHIYGTLLSNLPDYNGSQIQVDRIVVKD